jgi:hypothetical protein
MEQTASNKSQQVQLVLSLQDQAETPGWGSLVAGSQPLTSFKVSGILLWNYGLRVGGGALQRRASGRNSGTKNLLQQHTADEHLISKSSQNISK